MKAAIFHLTPVSNTLQASARIATFLGEELNLPVYDRKDDIKHNKHALEAALLVNSPTGFADPDWRWYVAEQCVRAKHFIFVQNDYKLNPPSQVQRWVERLNKPVKKIVWANMPVKCEASKDPRSSYVNWNLLTWVPGIKRRRPTKEGLLYYGALRKERIPDVVKYLNTDLYPCTISTPKRSHKTVAELLEHHAAILPQFGNVIAEIWEWPATIYIQDPWSNKNYNSPANRFYEALSAGVAILFDSKVVSTMKEAGYKVDPYVVENAADVEELLPSAEQIAKEQRRDWYSGQNYRQDLQDQIQKAWQQLQKGR